MRADPACRFPEHRATDWSLEDDTIWQCGVCQPPSRGLVKAGLAVYRDNDIAATAPAEGLTPAEVDRLGELERVVAHGLQTFVEVGNALGEIRDQRLYRATHRTFEDYCRERWRFVASRARQLIAAAETVTAVTLDGRPAPANEAVARELVPLRDRPDKLRQAWADTVERNGPTPTARQVRETVEARLSKVDDDLAARVREGKASLEYAESVTIERVARVDAWAAKLRDALAVLCPMAGYPVPPSVAERLTVDERAQLDVALEALAEAFGRVEAGERP